MSDLPDLTTIGPEERAALAAYPAWAEMATLWRMSQLMAARDNPIAPDDLRGKPGAVFQLLVMARDLGVNVSQAFTLLYVVKGKVGVSAQLMRAQVLRAGHQILTEERTTRRCVLTGVRKDGARLTVRWAISAADLAEGESPEDWYLAADIEASEANGTTLTAKSNWRNYPRAMLEARATTELARSLFPDVLVWAQYTPEEIGGDAHPDDLEPL